MNAQAKDKAKKATSNYLYPFKLLLGEGYPSTEHFEVMQMANGMQTGIRTRVAFDSRVCIAKISGYALSERRVHTLRLSPRIHLYDCWFTGLVMHSCNPNVFLDLHYLEAWTVRDIKAGEQLTMDYATTEDVLFRQFACQCGERNCRGWITGSEEAPNVEGSQWYERNRR